jgi:CubicO group peptidase (beta-lactamase class C family)
MRPIFSHLACETGVAFAGIHTRPAWRAIEPLLHFMIRPLITLALIVAGIGQIAAVEKKAGPQTIAELQAEIETILRETVTPGAAVALVSGDEVEWVAGLGLADVASERPATAQTLFRIGSVSKEFVALAALKLQEEGKLKLTDTFRQWLPECPIENPWESTEPVRLVHLLEHTSGVPDGRGRSWAHNDPKPATMAEAVALEPGNRYVRWRPGSRSGYTNYGTMLAAAVVEKAAGQRFEDYVRENFFAPLEMKTASYFLTSEVERAKATNYRAQDRQPVPYQHMIYRPSGAINASAEGMANYLRFHLQRGSFSGRRILTEESINRLEMPGTLPAVQAGITTGYGLYNAATFNRGFEEHGHAGGVDGAVAKFGYIPELGLGRAVMINTDNSRVLLRIWEAVNSYMMRDVTPLKMPADVSGVTLSEELQRSLPGYYVSIGLRDSDYLGLFEHYGSMRKVRADAQGLAFMAAFGHRWTRCIAVSENLFRLEKEPKPTLALVQGEDGETLLQQGQMTYQRISPLRVWVPLGGIAVSLPLVTSSLLFAVVWGLRKALGRLPKPGPWSVRLWPLFGAAALVGFFVFYAEGESHGFAVFGTPNVWTIGMMLMSLLIPLSTLFSVVAVWRHRRAMMNRCAYWHAVLVTLGLVFITGFFFAWELVGVRMWV